MRQLTSLDAQFLALENSRQTGHVGSLAMLDASTAPGGEFGCSQVVRLIEDRAAEIMALLLDLTPDGREVPPPADDDLADPPPTELQMLALGLLGVPRYPVRMLRALPKAIPNLEDTPFGIFPA